MNLTGKNCTSRCVSIYKWIIITTSELMKIHSIQLTDKVVLRLCLAPLCQMRILYTVWSLKTIHKRMKYTMARSP